MIDMIFEVSGLVTSAVLFFVVLSAGRRYPALAESNWRLVVVGFFVFMFGFGVNFFDEFELVNGDMLSRLETFSLSGGLLLAAIGFSRWFGFMARFLGVAKA